MIKLAGMVTLYNPTDEDFKNIDSYIKDVDVLYVIDNTEGKDNKDRLPKNKKIKYFFKNENVGVATALNEAAKMAIKDGYKYLLTNDQDTFFKKDVVKKMKEVIEKEDMKDVGIVVPWHNTKLKMKKVTEGYDYPETTMTSGNILMLDVWKKVGGFIDWFFIDGIDIEYSLKIREQGYKILRINSLEIDHNLGNIEYKTFLGTKHTISNHNYLRRYYIMRNNHYIFDMHKEFAPHICWNLISQKPFFIEVILFEKDKIRKIIAMLRGLRDYKKGIKGKYPYKK